MAILEKGFMLSADMQWLFYSGERSVAHGPPVEDIRVSVGKRHMSDYSLS